VIVLKLMVFLNQQGVITFFLSKFHTVLQNVNIITLIISNTGQLVHQIWDSSTIQDQYSHLPPPFENKLISVMFIYIYRRKVLGNVT